MDRISESEHRERIARAQQLMARNEVDALFFSSEANVGYLTGYSSHRWLQPTSPEYGVLPREGDPVLILPTIEMDRAGTHPWLRNLREATGGFPATIADVVRDVGAAKGRIAAELGSILRLCMTQADFDSLRADLDEATFVDGSDIFWSLRVPKSSTEVALLREACAITTKALAELHAGTVAGRSERELHAIMSAAVMKHGADRPGSMPLASRTPGEFHQADSHLRLHTDRQVKDGDLIWLDAGSIVGGYWSDTFRMYSLGKASQESRDAYATVYECVESALAAIKPGSPTRDAMDAFASVVNKSKYREFAEGRFRRASLAHGIGLDLIEPPFVNQTDTSILEPGTVLTVEPFIYQPDVGFFMIEEQVLVTDTGCEVLSDRAPPELPEV